MDKNNLVVKSNVLIEAKYKLSINEQRLILAAVSQIEAGDCEFKPYTFYLNDLTKLFGLRHHDMQNELHRMANGIMHRVIHIQRREPDENGETDWLMVHWFSSVEYFRDEGRIEVMFDPKLKPYLLQLKKRFTAYSLKQVISLHSSFAIRIYELLKQYETCGQRVFELKKLKDILGVSENYKLFKNFDTKVLKVAQAELKTKSDIYFDYEKQRRLGGPKITHIKFLIKRTAGLKPEDIPEQTLIFDYGLKDLTEKQQAQIRKHLAGVPDAQAVLDELNSNVMDGKVKARKPYISYLKTLIDRATGKAAEAFVPTSNLPERRRKAAVVQRSREANARQAQPPPKATTEKPANSPVKRPRSTPPKETPEQRQARIEAERERQLAAIEEKISEPL